MSKAALKNEGWGVVRRLNLLMKQRTDDERLRSGSVSEKAVFRKGDCVRITSFDNQPIGTVERTEYQSCFVRVEGTGKLYRVAQVVLERVLPSVAVDAVVP